MHPKDVHLYNEWRDDTNEDQQLERCQPGLGDGSGLAEREVSGNRHEKLLRHGNIFGVSSSTQQSHDPVAWLPTAAQTWAQSLHGTGHLQADDVTLSWGGRVPSSPLRKERQNEALSTRNV